jgi:hypothetical protein
MNHQADMRARLFRERWPAAFRILTDPNPPVLAKVPETITVAEAVAIKNTNRVMTLACEVAEARQLQVFINLIDGESRPALHEKPGAVRIRHNKAVGEIQIDPPDQK